MVEKTKVRLTEEQLKEMEVIDRLHFVNRTYILVRLANGEYAVLHDPALHFFTKGQYGVGKVEWIESGSWTEPVWGPVNTWGTRPFLKADNWYGKIVPVVAWKPVGDTFHGVKLE